MSLIENRSIAHILCRHTMFDSQSFLSRYRRIGNLLEQAVDFWRGVVDWENGGFYGLVDYAGKPVPFANKDMIQQTRHLWTFPNLYLLEGESESIAEICHHQFRFVRDALYRPEQADFYRTISWRGQPVAEGMHHYPMGFGLLGLSAYAAAFPDLESGQQSLSMAKSVFYNLVETTWEYEHGFNQDFYAIGWCDSGKEINTQMHLLEAVTELLAAARAQQDSSEPEIAAILSRMLELMHRRAIASVGDRYFCSRHYARDWRVINNWEIDYGHDIEVVYLVMAAANMLGRQSESNIVESVLGLAHSMADIAYDRKRGKWFYSGNPLTGKVRHKIANFWVHFEALNGLFVAYQLSGDEKFLKQFDDILSWLETKQINSRVGEWYYNVSNRGRPVNRDIFNGKCNWMTFPWKSSFHSLRALMSARQWIKHNYLCEKEARTPSERTPTVMESLAGVSCAPVKL